MIVVGLFLIGVSSEYEHESQVENYQKSKTSFLPAAKQPIPKEISELIKRAKNTASAYKKQISEEDLIQAWKEFSVAKNELYLEILSQKSDTLDQLRQLKTTLEKALDLAGENGWLFHQAHELVVSLRKQVDSSHQDVVNDLESELRQRWPEMNDSFKMSQTAQKGAMANIFNVIGQQSGGNLPSVPGINQILQQSAKMALEAVVACPVNPDAWFQLSYQLFAAGQERSSKKLDDVVASLKKIFESP